MPAFGADQALQYPHESHTRAAVEDDWISPYTLPPVPSIKPPHRGANPLSSPPRHRKSSSSAYYAAAWGSPTTPETSRSTKPFGSSDRREALSHLVESRHSERGNWLSDSEGSVRSSPWPPRAENSVKDWLRLRGDDQNEAAARTPTLGSFIESQNNTSGSARSGQPGTGHRIQDSTATISQAGYRTQPGAKHLLKDIRAGEMSNHEVASNHAEQTAMVDLALGTDKPLPFAPGQLDGVSDMNSPTTRPLLRPQTSGMQSFQRSKKKVLWKGKSCVISLPTVDGRGSENAPFLTPADVQARLQDFEQEGYNITGFVLGDLFDVNSSDLGGQSRNIHPDPVEVLAERQSQRYKVSIPDRAEWDAWMDFMKEGRLRALGVTTSDSEPPPSTRSPFSSTMSHTSSQYPSVPFSPPQPPSSVGSSHLLQSGHTFSPHVNPSTGASSQAPSLASPISQFVGLPGPIHRYKQPAAYSPAEARMLSPPNHPVTQTTLPAPGQQSPPHYFVQRQSSVSPAALGGMQSLGEILSPVSPFPAENYGGPSPPNIMLDTVRQRQQQIMLNQPRAVSGPLALPDTETQLRSRIEIAHPTPRPHQRNHSEALQREIDEAETQLERESQENVPVKELSGNLLQGISYHTGPLMEQITIESTRNSDAVGFVPNTEAADHPEMETNLSLRASPMPDAQAEPFSERPVPAGSRSQLPGDVSVKHKVKPSVSRLNVEAKEFKFDPTAAFLSSNFQFGSKAFQLAATAAQLNAAAPEFQPSKAVDTEAAPTRFNFSSSTFNVDAPEFNPSGSIGSHFESSIASASDDPSSATSKIFGRFNIDPSSKATRRSAKALPIAKPAADTSDQEERDKVEDDEFGRPAPSMARSKRARRGGSEEDQDAVYAPHDKQVLAGVDVSDSDVPAASPAEHALPASSDTDKQSSPDKWEPFSFKDEVDASIFNSARPPHSGRPLPASASSSEFGDLVTSDRPTTHRPNPSLSTSGPPLVPVSEQRDLVVPTLTPDPVRPQTASDLMASRFAATPSTSSPSSPTSSVDVDRLHTEPDISHSHNDTPEPQQGHINRKILEKIVSEAYRSDAENSVPISGADGASEPGQELRNGKIFEEIISEAHIADAEKSVSPSDADVFEPRRELHNSRILQEIVSEVHASEPEKSVPSSEIDEGSVRPVPGLSPVSTSDQLHEPIPSYEEIDEVMKQLSNDPDLGVERLDTPILRSSPAPTPQMRPPPNIRSDAPSPSPRRIQGQYVPQNLPPQDLQVPFEAESGLEFQVRGLNGHRDGEVSDWNGEVSSPDAQKLQSRAQFFDSHVIDLVGGILDNRVGPMERTLNTIQHSLAAIATRPAESRRERRSLSTDRKDSDADDEDDDDGLDALIRHQTRSPTARKDIRSDKLRLAIGDALAAHKAQNPENQAPDLSALSELLTEMRHLARQVSADSRQAELKAIVEDVIATHPRLRGHRVKQSHDFGGNEERSQLQISGLETMLKMANERADQEAIVRHKADDDLADALRRLRYAEEEAAHYRESSEEAERTLMAYHQEKESLANLEETVSELSLKNAALETTLEEYRLSSDQWRDDIREERAKNKELRHTIHSLKRHLEESADSKQSLRSKVDRLQENLASAVRDIASDQALSRKQELELIGQNDHLQNTLEHEIRRREKCELELDDLDKEHKQNVHFRDRCAHLQQENSRLEQAMFPLRQECKEAQDVAFHSQRELQHARESTERRVQQATSALEADLKLATSQASIVRADLEAQMARLQDSLEHAELDAANAKAKHDALIEETLEGHSRALQQAVEEKETTLQTQQSAHEKKLNDLRERHTRALHNSSDDRHRLEHHLNERLALSDEKVQHLESKVADVQERLEITKSAARAAVEAATIKGINLPTPANSVVASPPHSTMASMPLVQGSEIPEKISPQALRESIMVLQDQLQNREQRIEQLEAEISQVDKEAPVTIRDRDTEIAWLRELLGVRIDDLEDIIKTLSQQEFDREAVQGAAIRLRANLQMEQQEKERSASGVSKSFPSIASLSSLTQSPRALPMAAAAAWGNWRKGRDSSFGPLTDLTNLGNQTPSRSTVGGSPQSFLAGLMTPPGTNQRQVTPSAGNATAPPTMMSLGTGGRKPSGEARPLRAYNAQARSLSARQMEKQPISTARTGSQQRPTLPEPPSTPPLMRTESYDGDADVRSLSGDLDADASPINGQKFMLSGDNFSGEGEGEGELSL